MTEVQKTWDNDMKDQVVSWIENEDRCVTTQGICQELGISRNQASQLLQEILNAKQDCKVYSVSQQVNNDNASVQETVFQLGSSTLEQVQSGDSTTVFALAGTGTAELVSTAHERDMVQWRDALANSDNMVTECPSFILPADDILPLQHKKLERSLAPPTKTASSTTTSSSSAIRKTPFSGATKVQKTTAASFFGKSKSTSSTSTAASAATSKSSTSLPKPVKEESKQPTTAKPPQPVQAKENTVQSINKPRASSSKTAKVGSVDDFVGDVEDSDDEGPVLSSKARRKAAVEKAKRDVARDESINEPNPAEDDDDDNEPVVRGAMDAFAVHKPAPAPAAAAPSSGPRTQKRRKLVDKVVRVDGYLKTVTEYVWEEVPIEEEVDKPKTSLGKSTSSSSAMTSNNKPQAKKPNPQAMKQKSLMGFFAKK